MLSAERLLHNLKIDWLDSFSNYNNCEYYLSAVAFKSGLSCAEVEMSLQVRLLVAWLLQWQTWDLLKQDTDTNCNLASLLMKYSTCVT